MEDQPSYLLRKPVPLALAVLCAVRLMTWAPHYMTWPWWADHDVFATMAQAWEAGLLPYRDLRGNNFPGTIYLFWVLGKLFGWGRTWSFYAADVALLVLLGIALTAWSRRRSGRSLPGLVGFLTVQSIYFNLDFSQVAQRDWQGPLVAVVGLLTLQAWPGTVGGLASALALAVALAIRPQVVLLLPAFISALDEAARPPGRPPSRTVFAAIGWGLVLLVFLGLAFAPLARAGVLDDFVQGVRLVGYGASYSRWTFRGALGEFLGQLGSVSLWAVPALIACLVGSARPPARRRAVTWGLALLGVLFYLPLSPVTRPYLTLPLMLVWSVNVAVLVGLVLEARPASPPLQLAAVVLILLFLKATSWPRFCAPLASLRALSAPMRDVGLERAPEGYVHPYGPMVPLYPWQDYRATLRELRRNTSPETRVANALMGVALTGPAARLPAFPAESATWLFVVRPEAEAEFARALEEAPDSVVVWAPGELGATSIHRFGRLESLIRRLYEPQARFGSLEIWRRRRARP